jgi:nicotinate phosphoribosyltransferase
MITSLLDTDLYKLTMANAIFEKFPNYQVKYEFFCRNEQHWTQEMFEVLQERINTWCTLTFKRREIDYLINLCFFKPAFIEFLRLYKPNPGYVHAWLEGDQLHLTIRGPWYMTVFYEVPLLAIINETYFYFQPDRVQGRERLEAKADKLSSAYDIKFADFGTRRRYSKWWHREVLERLMECSGLVGTSNVMFAMEFDIKPIGTMAHEWIMAGAGRPDCSFVESQKAMLQTWTDVYRGDLGIALTDTYGMDKFERDFDPYFAKLYDGIRHDSGDPVEWFYRAKDMYSRMGIDPLTKQFVFSDGLTTDRAKELNEHFREYNVSFGIGTHFTNDFENLTPLSIVIKMTECNGHPTIKISDEPAKMMCNDYKFKQYALHLMDIKNCWKNL